MRRRNRLLAAVAGVVALLLPAPATAATTVPPIWLAAPCATGAITAYAGTLDDDDARLVTVSGWIQPCTPGVLPGTKFGFVHYYTDAALMPVVGTLGTGLRDYRPPTAPTTFTITTGLDAAGNVALEERHGALRALCVVRTINDPVACIAVDGPSSGVAPTAVPIPVDDERVRVPLIAPGPEFADTDPHCGNCI
jgi:hypothetical protein